jgi:hypothetical protein
VARAVVDVHTQQLGNERWPLLHEVDHVEHPASGHISILDAPSRAAVPHSNDPSIE